MKSLQATLFFFIVVVCTHAQSFAPDARLKADILVIVAHPDDESLIGSYLARAIFDQHKKVAVVYCTSGDSGANSEGHEYGQALALVRQTEARQALSLLGITNLWFLDGHDSASNDVLIALGYWPSGTIAQQIVRVIRLTRPEVIVTWLPSTVAGENHGDHQAAAVLATEGFDMAGNPTAFPSQLASPVRRYAHELEGLVPWQPKKLYYFTDAFDTSFFHGHGPEYSAKELSPSRKVTYFQLAVQSLAAYYTQAPDPQIYHQIASGKDLDQMVAKVEKMDYLDDMARLWLGKSHVKSSITGDVFEGIDTNHIAFAPPQTQTFAESMQARAQLGGVWAFYHDFWREHELESLRSLRPEVSVFPGGSLLLPVKVRSMPGKDEEFTFSVVLPPGWTQKDSATRVTVPAGGEASMAITVVAPSRGEDSFQEIRMQVASDGKTLFEGTIFAKVVAPQ